MGFFFLPTAATGPFFFHPNFGARIFHANRNQIESHSNPTTNARNALTLYPTPPYARHMIANATGLGPSDDRAPDDPGWSCMFSILR